MSIRKLKKNRRTFIKAFFSLLLVKSLHTRLVSADEENNYLINGPLAGSIYYTKNKPGKWKNLVESHTPLLEIYKNTLKVSTLHEMKGFEHYIIKHIVLDNKFNIISEKIFDPSKDIPISKHNIMGYNDKLYILSICNQHDTWLDIIKI
ncbi:MAG: hypothetical protein CMJ06_04370 [Pelagibacterales bacterium]|nr:hypothetical protein [Pelagibacterales bacterium]OUU61947.1 MAG: hypothetical protein CBC22_05820 [Alphaproteobacteria bacterium TMED62]|tara:strand:- start:19240 stop:19686 length:447 start_codon:yes stop_codon:yes gene_type:complete